MNETKRKSVIGNGNGVKEIPVKIPDSIRRSLSFNNNDFSSADKFFVFNKEMSFNF
ncbi:MAG: hypothetical protein ACUVT3_04080 [Ignavibacterium sp.]